MILPIEDEPGIVDFVKRGLEAGGFPVEAALDPVPAALDPVPIVTVRSADIASTMRADAA
jgi:DNA-binding response OmpR family regulator